MQDTRPWSRLPMPGPAEKWQHNLGPPVSVWRASMRRTSRSKAGCGVMPAQKGRRWFLERAMPGCVIFSLLARKSFTQTHADDTFA